MGSPWPCRIDPRDTCGAPRDAAAGVFGHGPMGQMANGGGFLPGCRGLILGRVGHIRRQVQPVRDRVRRRTSPAPGTLESHRRMGREQVGKTLTRVIDAQFHHRRGRAG